MAERVRGLGTRVEMTICCAVVVMFCVTHPASGEVLRLSKVVAEGTADAKRFEYQNGEVSETLFIENQAIVTRLDVESVVKSPQEADALAIRLTKEGGEKLGAATKDAHGDMRIAVLIDEKVMLAAVVNQQLGNQFVIDGLKEYSGEDMDLLVWRIEGKSDEEIAKLLWELQQVKDTPPPPRPEPEYYSEEEYVALKNEREKIGMFYLDQLPTEGELGKRLKVGMPQEGVVDEFGKANRTACDKEGNLISMGYELAPERYSLSNEMRPCGFSVHFSKGSVTRWSIDHYSSSPREPKPPKGGPRALDAVFPGEGFADKDFGTVKWIEGIELFLKDTDAKPNAQDYGDLLSIIFSCSTSAEESDLIEANCSVVKTLAEAFPEVEELRKTAKDGKIGLRKLRNLVRPYILGEKQFPDFSETP